VKLVCLKTIAPYQDSCGSSSNWESSAENMASNDEDCVIVVFFQSSLLGRLGVLGNCDQLEFAQA
jgi:hypothetical protein